MAKVITVLGTRPEIVKLSPLIPLLKARFSHVLIHSGQHYSYEMDAVFFEELALPRPDYPLDVGSAAHGEQTARMLSRLEPILVREAPDLVVVQGDTNTTLAGALAAAKLKIPVAHVEAGCRSFNRAMPEELNRVVVDHISRLLFAPDAKALAHLRAEGLPDAQVVLSGSTGVDACERSRDLARQATILERLGLETRGYLVLTLHRAENTLPAILPGIVAALEELSRTFAIVFPVHPRTAVALDAQGLSLPQRVITLPPLGYLDMIRLVNEANAVLTDSGGLQEEAAVLGVPALVLRGETEWQELIDAGMHVLAGNTRETILATSARALQPESLTMARARPLTARGGASKRIVTALERFLATSQAASAPGSAAAVA